MTYKELMRELPDDITPEDAQKEYKAYLADWWGSEVRSSAAVQLWLPTPSSSQTAKVSLRERCSLHAPV